VLVKAANVARLAREATPLAGLIGL